MDHHRQPEEPALSILPVVAADNDADADADVRAVASSSVAVAGDGGVNGRHLQDDSGSGERDEEGEEGQEGNCVVPKVLDTGINDNEKVPPFHGIMFVMTSTTDLEVLGLDVDVRVEEMPDGEPYHVEVYVYDGEYFQIGDHLDYRNNPNDWKPVFKGLAVRLSFQHNLVLPAADFEPIRMAANSRKSLYITMKGPWLDHNVNALQQRGEFMTTARGSDLNLLVGSGLSSYYFPEQINATVDPMFAGLIYFDKVAGDCSELTTTSSSDYIFIFRGNKHGEVGTIAYNKSIATIVQIVTDAVRKALVSYAETSTTFLEYADKFQLQLQGVPVTESRQFDKGHECPDGWDECGGYYVHSRVTLRHNDQLNSETVLFEMYREELTRELVLAVKSALDGMVDDVSYTGLTSLEARYEIKLAGVDPSKVDTPEDGTMSKIKTKWFIDTTRQFLNAKVDSKLASNFDVTVAEQELISAPGGGDVGRRRSLLGRFLRAGDVGDGLRRLEEKPTLKVTGQIRGGRLNFLAANEFDNTVGETLKLDKGIYKEMLKSGGLRPGLINQDGRYEYFTSITDVSSTVTLGNVGKSDGKSSGGDVTVIAAVVAVLGVLSAGIGLYFLRRYMKKKADEKANIADYRQHRARERQKKKAAFVQLTEDINEIVAAEQQQEMAPGSGKTKDTGSDSVSDGDGDGDDVEFDTRLLDGPNSSMSFSKLDDNNSRPSSRRPSADMILKRQLSADQLLKLLQEQHEQEAKAKKEKDEEVLQKLQNMGIVKPGVKRANSCDSLNRSSASLSGFLEGGVQRRGSGDKIGGARSVDGGGFERPSLSRSKSDDLRSVHTSAAPGRNRSSGDLIQMRNATRRGGSVKLGDFMNREPKPDETRMSASRTVGPGYATENAKLPDRGVRPSFSSSSAHARGPPSTRGVGRSASFDSAERRNISRVAEHDDEDAESVDESVKRQMVGRSRSDSFDRVAGKGGSQGPGSLGAFMNAQPKLKGGVSRGAMTVGPGVNGNRAAPQRDAPNNCSLSQMGLPRRPSLVAGSGGGNMQPVPKQPPARQLQQGAPQSENERGGGVSLGAFMNSEPSNQDGGMSGARTVGPGVANGGDRRAPSRSVSASNNGMAPAMMNRASPFPPGPPQRSKSSGPGLQRQQQLVPPKTPTSPGKMPSLGSYMQRQQQPTTPGYRISGARTVGGAPSRGPNGNMPGQSPMRMPQRGPENGMRPLPASPRNDAQSRSMHVRQPPPLKDNSARSRSMHVRQPPPPQNNTSTRSRSMVGHPQPPINDNSSRSRSMVDHHGPPPMNDNSARSRSLLDQCQQPPPQNLLRGRPQQQQAPVPPRRSASLDPDDRGGSALPDNPRQPPQRSQSDDLSNIVERPRRAGRRPRGLDDV